MRGMDLQDYTDRKDELSEKWVAREISSEVFLKLRDALTDVYNGIPDPQRPEVLPRRKAVVEN